MKLSVSPFWLMVTCLLTVQLRGGAISDLKSHETPAFLSGYSLQGADVAFDPAAANMVHSGLVYGPSSEGTINVAALEGTADRASSVRAAGAVGDGRTDDTAAINRALATLRTVWFPPGTYLIDARANIVTNVCGASGTMHAGLVIPSNRHLIFDPEATIAVSHTEAGEYNAMLAVDATNIIIDGGRLVGDRHDSGGRKGEFGYGLVVAGCSNILIRSFTSVSNWGDGVFFCCGAQKAQNTRVTLENCTLADNRRNNASIITGREIVFDHCALLRAKGVPPQSGIDIEPDMSNLLGIAPVVSDILIQSCRIQSNSSSGIDMQHATANKQVVIRNVKICECLIQGNGKSGVYHGSLTQGGIEITRNLICGNGDFGMNLTAMRNSRIRENLVSTNAASGIEFSSSQNCVIASNLFWNNCTSKNQRCYQLQVRNFASDNTINNNIFVAHAGVSTPLCNLLITNSSYYFCLRNEVRNNRFFKGSAMADLVDGGFGTKVSSNLFGIAPIVR